MIHSQDNGFQTVKTHLQIIDLLPPAISVGLLFQKMVATVAIQIMCGCNGLGVHSNSLSELHCPEMSHVDTIRPIMSTGEPLYFLATIVQPTILFIDTYVACVKSL